MLGTNQTNLVIVYTAEAREHAEYLRNLIGLTETVKAVTCKDKEFDEKNNTSAQKVIYIGDCKSAVSTKKHAKWKFNEYGLRCGWLGNKAMLYIETPLKKRKDYEKFYEYGKSVAIRMEEQFKNVKEDSTGQKIGKVLSTVSIIAWIYVPFVGIPGVYNLTATAIKRNKAVKQQQYDTMVRLFYLDHLQKFIEGKA